MKYLSSTIALIVERLNRQYFLPAIQREFVWKPEQVIQLFDSLLRGYPISSFLFWELTDENRNKWPAYQFIEAASQGTHNQRANTDGIQQMTLVLDGQQRLTSLLVGLKGTYAIKKKYKHKLSPDSWTTKRLFLDLFQESRSKEAGVDENETDIYYGLEFHENQPPADVEHYWFKVGGILNFPDADKFYDFKFEEKERFPGETTKKQIANFEKNLQKLYDVVWKDDVIAYYTEHEQEYDRVLDIFVRANMGGTKLSKSELLLSMITAVWDGINAREAIHNFVDSLNNDLPRKNNLSKDFVMKACLALTDLSVRYKADNFSNEHLGIIKDNWEGIKKSIVRGVELGNRYGLDRDTLTSANALIPVIYFLHDRPSINLASGSKPFEVRNREIIRRWLISVMINRIFSGSSDNLLTAIRGVLKEQSSDADFPVKEIGAVAGQSGPRPPISFDDDAIDMILSELAYRKPSTYLALSLLYDDSAWASRQEQDHIFPKSFFTKKCLNEAGFNEAKQNELQESRDRFANLQLLTDAENREKSNKPFDRWIESRDPTFLKLHLIPDDPKLWKLERFLEFIEAREQLIRKRLGNLLSPGK